MRQDEVELVYQSREPSDLEEALGKSGNTSQHTYRAE